MDRSLRVIYIAAAILLTISGILDIFKGHGKLAIVECVAGTAVPTVRNLGDRMATRGVSLVRINVREPQVPRGHHSLPLPALEALRALDALLRE